MAFVVSKSDTMVNTFVPFQRITSDLVINKAVEHPYGAGYKIPDNIAFDFEVNLGSYYAGSTIKTTNGNIKADKDGKITVTAKANSSVGIEGIDVGTKVTVTEIQKADSGFSVKDGQPTKETVITAGADASVDYINVYQPQKLKLNNINVRGNKQLEGGCWQEGYTYTFVLEQETQPNVWTSLGTTTVTYDANNTNFNQFDFSSIFRQMEFEQLGTYNFRISEVEGDNPNITYDKTVHTINIVVNDRDMDGKVELENVVLNGKAASKDGKTGIYNLEVVFNNKFTPDKIEVPIIVDKEMICENTKAKIGPENFEFVLENVDTGEVFTTKTDEQGDAKFVLGFTEKDIGKTFNFKLKETNGGNPCIDFDTTVYNFQIRVELGKDNKLVAHLIYQHLEVTDFVARFTNRYKEPIPVDTGDHNSVVLWSVMFVTGAMTIVVLLVTRRKINKRCKRY